MKMSNDTRELVSDCIYRLIAKNGNDIYLPMSETLNATSPKDVVHFDFLCLGPSDEDYRSGMNANVLHTFVSTNNSAISHH